MTATTSLSAIHSQVFELMEPLESEDRHKIIASVMALLGEKPTSPTTQVVGSTSYGGEDDLSFGDRKIGRAALRWIKQNQLDTNTIEQVFLIDQTSVEIIAAFVPGSTKKEQTCSAYLLTGIKALIDKDDSNFTDTEALSLCKLLGCYDKNNHSTNRSSLGNKVAGNRTSGFTLPQPGLKAAAEVVRQIAKNSQ
ncbi:MAG: hypothetical protein IH984_11760 [Planctomycetes bacterium]|nr:hypothetical protein [Planctomycetota bacterium]